MEMTKIKCLELCLLDWINVAEKDCGKMDLPLEDYGVEEFPKNSCFCCEYVNSKNENEFTCSLCPLNGFAWERDHENVETYTYGCQCEGDPLSPYRGWEEMYAGETTTNIWDGTPAGKTKLAWMMVDACEAALAYEYLREMNCA